jgi:hypothetical protein
MISGNKHIYSLIMRRTKNVPRETLLELQAIFFISLVHHEQRGREVFHMKHFEWR